MSTKSNEKVISRKNELKSNEDNSANNQESSVSQSLLQPPSPTRNASSSGVANVIVNPMQNSHETAVEPVEHGSPGTESPGTSQMSPPPSYHDIPGTVPAHQGVSRGPPPSYEDAVDPNAEPPSYDSLFGRIRDTHKASRNFIDFLAKLLLLLLGTIGCTIACGVTVFIPICMIVIGSIHFHDCPAEPYIPLFLIVGGAFSVFKYLIGVITRIRQGDSNSQDNPPQPHPAQSLITCFLCGWFITGCVWVYRVYKPDFNENAGHNYCNETVYIFAFWLITTAYIFLGLFTSCICCFSIVSVIFKREY